MKISLIICTYLRPISLLNLLQSIEIQYFYPYEILIVDGSTNDETAKMLNENNFQKINYFQVEPQFRGLTKQRNFGIAKVAKECDIVAFLDDDTELMPNYFEVLKETFLSDDKITGVGGIAINENGWRPIKPSEKLNKYRFFEFDGFVYKEGIRNVLRNYLGLHSNLPPGKMPAYSHGKTCGFPLNGKIYEVDLLIGMSFAFRREVIEQIKFSTYFEGYGLYEDADFSIRALKFGKNVINTNLQLNHFHHPSGRPDQYKYGKMVVRNGWYVWRVKNKKPNYVAIIKWNSITFLLTLIKFSNTLTTKEKKAAFTESIGRIVGWLSLIFNKPKLDL